MCQSVRCVGKHFSWMGRPVGDHTRLAGEEALFLLECGQVELSLGGVPVSVQQGYGRLLGDDPRSGDRFAVYRKLVKTGFKVVRHTGTDHF